MCLTVSFIPIGIIGGTHGFQYISLLLIGLILIVTFLVSLFISHFITKPIKNLTESIEAISKGKLEEDLEKSEIYEVNSLTESLNRVMASLKLAIHKVGVKKGEIFEETVREKEAAVGKYQDLVDNLIGWAWEIDKKGVYTFCSKNVSDILDYQPNEMIGKSFFYFMPTKDAKKFKQIFAEANKKGAEIKQFENWNVRKDGKKVCMITNAVPFFDENSQLMGYRGVDMNITKNKQSERKIEVLNTEISNLRRQLNHLLNKRQKKKWTKIIKETVAPSKQLEDKWIEQEVDAIFLFDEHANLLDCNENMYKQLGYTKGEMLSLNIVDFDALESKDDIIDKIEEARRFGSINFKTIHKRKDGSAVLVSEYMKCLKGENMFKCVVRPEHTKSKIS